LRQFLVFWKGIGLETVRQVRLLAVANKCSFWDIVKDIAKNPKEFKRIKLRKEVSEVHTFISSLLAKGNVQEIVEDIFNQFPNLKNDRGGKILYNHFQKFNKAGDLVSLKDVLDDFEAGMESGELENKDQEEENAVRIMTMHSAKGLDAGIVIVPALEDDIMPGNVKNIEEKRRLFYVSMTRAKYGLFLSWANQRSGPEIHKVPGRTMLGKKKSRFLEEIMN
jgi:superfamily I DNA/RNA helicase